jgi:hypothetical protein
LINNNIKGLEFDETILFLPVNNNIKGPEFDETILFLRKKEG